MNIILNQLEIETCSLCNRKCPWCLFGQIPDFRGNELQFLEIRYIEKIFRECIKVGESVCKTDILRLFADIHVYELCI